MEKVRPYQIYNTVFAMPPKHCVFCKHCTDIFCDSKGPYMFICELNIENKKNCSDFEDSGYVFDEASYLEMMKERGFNIERNFNDDQIVGL